MEFPVCAVCNKPVDRIEWFDDHSARGRVFRVFCHGKVEEQVLTDRMALHMVRGTEIAFGNAFTAHVKAIEDKGR
ncbi:hypothetical protein [Aquitalea aquatica]|uniref:Uncharacterized protein n=1 Tax=Aquitalea aquatica TaxID=3044273 RepID=A0A838Y943_9NEIS|nr:hypothetical protein [Aquitalea magnusonii]MBA4707555.1 hypothetical protein [Aquitalea magnusonii]